jgi:hypothetical protein
MRGRLQDSDGETSLNAIVLPDIYAGETSYKKFFIQNNLDYATGFLTYAIEQIGTSDLIGLMSWCLDSENENDQTLSCPFNVTATLEAGGSLTENTKYYYRITGFNYNGETTGSIEVNATTTVANKTIKLEWSELEGAEGYIIYRSTNRDYTNGRKAIIEDPETLEWSDTGQASDPSSAYNWWPEINSDYDLPIENTTAGESPDYGIHPISGSFSDDDIEFGVIEPGQQKIFWIKVATTVATPESTNPRNALIAPTEV